MKIFTEPIAKTIIVIGGILFVVTPFVFFWKDFHNLSFSASLNDGKFSNYGSLLSGLVGTFWSLAGVILFYVALTEQRKDIRISSDALAQQIKEFELQTIELSETRKIVIEQSKTQSLQRFENTFFKLLELHASLVISLRLPGGIDHGRSCFQALNHNVASSLNASKGPARLMIYGDLFNSNQESLSHYFQNFFHVLSFIDRANIEDKEFYSGLFRAQLSAHELSVAFYYGTTTDGLKFKPLAERLQLFKEAKLGNIHVPSKETFKEYSACAFGHSTYDFLELAHVNVEDVY